MTLHGFALLAEVVGVLAQHQDLPVVPSVDMEDGVLTVTLAVHPPSSHDALEALALRDELRCLLDTVQVRELAVRYDLSPDDLEPLLRRIHGESSERPADVTRR